MAKKSRRPRWQESTVLPPEVSNQPQPATLPVMQRAVDFAGEYAHIYREMRNVFIIAVVMVVVLFVLSYTVY